MDLWGVADTMTEAGRTEGGVTGVGMLDGERMGVGSSNGAVATIVELRRRVAILEEGFGRLLVSTSLIISLIFSLAWISKRHY